VVHGKTITKTYNIMTKGRIFSYYKLH